MLKPEEPIGYVETFGLLITQGAVSPSQRSAAMKSLPRT
jgi:hypothetical protein